MTINEKASHGLKSLEPYGSVLWVWHCECGTEGGFCMSEGSARDGHAEHVQEQGYRLAVGFEVVESLHGESCAGCRKAARSASIDAMVTGSVGAVHIETSPCDPWEDPEVAHSARVARPGKREADQS